MTLETGKALFSEQINQICTQLGTSKHEAFSRWICEEILDITNEEKIDEAVSIGGKDDCGINVFHADDMGDDAEQHVCWIQVKFSETLDYHVDREEVESFASTLGHLRDCPDHANMTFMQKSAEFVRMEEKYPHVKKRMILAVAGRLGDQANDLINDPEWRKERLPDPDVRLEILDLDDILSHVTAPCTPGLRIEFDGKVIERKDTETGKKSVLGHVRADLLVNMARDHRGLLFLASPRQAIGDTAPTHRVILDTLRDDDERQRFWRLNNGVTAICTGLEPAGNSAYNVENFKIVNGRQTIYTLEKSTHPIDDVFLLLIIHETADGEEGNLIRGATNAQNPIRPADLATSYPEMAEMVLQCRRDFPEFYFERKTNGFGAAARSVRARVTHRRVMDKGSTARAYYAYAINPADAMVPDKVLFSTAGYSDHYERVFKDRNIRDLVVPYIFMQMLDGLHRKWCGELKDVQSEKTSRDKCIMSKDAIKYFIMRFIYESMAGIDGSRRESIKDNMIERFRALKKGDPFPQEFIGIAQSAYDVFMSSFDSDRRKTWPEDLIGRISQKNYRERPDDVPSPYDMMSVLKQRGDRLLPHLLQMRERVIRQRGDAVRDRLLELAADAS